MRFVAVLVSHVLFVGGSDWRRSGASRVLIAIDVFSPRWARFFFTYKMCNREEASVNDRRQGEAPLVQHVGMMTPMKRAAAAHALHS